MKFYPTTLLFFDFVYFKFIRSCTMKKYLFQFEALEILIYNLVLALDCYIFITLHCRTQFIRYPAHAKRAFGQKKGCFETPDEKIPPSKNIECEEILPLTYDDKPCNSDAMNNPDPLIHPDSNSVTRYCLGTGLQMRQGAISHKTNACSYHNASLSKDGKLLKTMIQESLQMERKFKTIQQVIYSRLLS